MENQISTWLLVAAEQEGKRVETVDFIFCTDEYLHKINLEYLQHDDYTDVITFPYSETEIHGDVFISIERIRENAATVGVSFLHELCRVLVHGLLHLAGHSDKTPDLRAAMSAKEDFYLAKIAPIFTQAAP